MSWGSKVLLQIWLLKALLRASHAWSPIGQRTDFRNRFQQSTSHIFSNPVSSSPSGSDGRWLNHGLLFSSFSDGLSQNVQGRLFLQQGLVKALLQDDCDETEDDVRSSVMASPCNGPDVSILDDLENIDTRIEEASMHPDPVSLLVSSPSSLPRQLRLVYIPTAMYALRVDSNNTPGKQRQRARADGKKRRNNIVSFLEETLMEGRVEVSVVTLDLDDGSVKQAQGPDADTQFPTSGTGALKDWKPHMIYVEGGNTFWLAHCVEKGVWGELLREAATRDGTVYCGSSAGAILVGNSVETACWKGWDDPRVVPGREDQQTWKNAPGLGLVGSLSFFPHMDESWEELVSQKRKGLPEVQCLSEEAVLCVRGADLMCYLDPGTVTKGDDIRAEKEEVSC